MAAGEIETTSVRDANAAWRFLHSHDSGDRPEYRVANVVALFHHAVHLLRTVRFCTGRDQLPSSICRVSGPRWEILSGRWQYSLGLSQRSHR